MKREALIKIIDARLKKIEGLIEKHHDDKKVCLVLVGEKIAYEDIKRKLTDKQFAKKTKKAILGEEK